MNSNGPCDVNKAHCLKTQLVIREVRPLSTFVKKQCTSLFGANLPQSGKCIFSHAFLIRLLSAHDLSPFELLSCI